MRYCRAAVGRVVVACAAVAAAIFAGMAAGASTAPPGQRLIVVGESLLGPSVRVLDEKGRKVGDLASQSGLNGGVAVSRDGRSFAYVGTLDLFDSLPAVIRDQVPFDLPAPRPQLLYESFLESTMTGSWIPLLQGPVRGGVPVGRPAWSPDGRRIVVAEARRGHVRLYVRKAGSSASGRLLTSGRGRDMNPAWAPGGRTIAYEHRDRRGTDVYAIEADGTGVRNLTGWHGDERWPTWSPDGRSVAFAATGSGRSQLYTLSLVDGSVRRLTSGLGNATHPVWSPDGRLIAFSTDRDGDNDAFVIDVRTGRERRLTANASEDLVQDWQRVPDPSRPRLRALPSTGRIGGPLRLKFTVDDQSSRVRIEGELEYRVVNGAGISVGGSAGFVGQLFRPIPGKVRELVVSDLDLGSAFFIVDGLESDGAEEPRPHRFCLTAADEWGNVARSCAPLRLRP